MMGNQSAESKPSNNLAGDLDIMVQDVESPQEAVTAFLVGLSGKHAGKLFRVRPGESMIGRSSRALVTLDEKAVSHQHAKLQLNSRGCFVIDQGSTNGTYVNDERIEEPTELRAGDVLRCGTSTLGFLTDADDQEQHTRALARVTGGPTKALAPQHHGGSGPPMASPAAGAGPGAMVPHYAPGMSPYQQVDESPMRALDRLLDKLTLLWRFLMRYWKPIALTSVIFAILAALTVAFMPPAAVAEFEIVLKHEGSENPNEHFASQGIDFFSSAEKNFTKLDLVKKTMADMGVKTESEDAIRGTAKNLAFEAEGGASYVGEYSHPDADYAEEFLGVHVQNYLKREIGKAIKVLQSEVDMLQREYDSNQQKLEELGAEVRDFKEKHINSLPDTAANQLGARVDLLTRRDQLTADLERYSNELSLARSQLSSEDALVEEKVQRSAPYEQALADVRRKLADAQAKGFAEGHPDVIKYRTEEKELLRLRDRTINSATTDTDRRANPEHKRLQNRVGELGVAVNATRKELGLVQSRLGELDEVAGDLPKVEERYSDLERKLAAAQRLHERLGDQLRAKELQLDFERASAAARYEVVREPHAYPVDPVQTASLRASVGAFAGALFGVFGAAVHWLIGYARRRRHNSGLPALT